MSFNPFQFLVRLDAKVNRILSMTERIDVKMANLITRAEFNSKLDEAVAVLAAEIEQVKKAIEEKVPPEVDLTPEFAKLSTLIEGIKGIIPDPVPVVE